MTSEGLPDKISEEDFYARHKEFSIWLGEQKGVNIAEIKTSKAKKLFSKFVKKWNNKELPQLQQDPKLLDNELCNKGQSQQNWNFKLSEQDKEDLEAFAKEIRAENIIISSEENKNKNQPEAQEINQMEIKNIQNPNIIGPMKPSISIPKSQENNKEDSETSNFIGPLKSKQILSKPEELKELKTKLDKQAEREEEIENYQKEQRQLKKKWKREQDEQLEDLMPKKVGKELIQEKKKEVNKKMKGQREKDADIADHDVQDDSSNWLDNLKKIKKEKEKEKYEKKIEAIEEARQSRLNFEKSEDQKVKQLLESLGLARMYKENK